MQQHHDEQHDEDAHRALGAVTRRQKQDEPGQAIRRHDHRHRQFEGAGHVRLGRHGAFGDRVGCLRSRVLFEHGAQGHQQEDEASGDEHRLQRYLPVVLQGDAEKSPDQHGDRREDEGLPGQGPPRRGVESLHARVVHRRRLQGRPHHHEQQREHLAEVQERRLADHVRGILQQCEQTHERRSGGDSPSATQRKPIWLVEVSTGWG